ncbi:hypothetical protein J6590_017760 [Homalodisca vitripennis]|nr:hypothetical protein J6590_017760 [Homalodisca vitripennis]
MPLNPGLYGIPPRHMCGSYLYKTESHDAQGNLGYSNGHNRTSTHKLKSQNILKGNGTYQRRKLANFPIDVTNMIALLTNGRSPLIANRQWASNPCNYSPISLIWWKPSRDHIQSLWLCN